MKKNRNKQQPLTEEKETDKGVCIKYVRGGAGGF